MDPSKLLSEVMGDRDGSGAPDATPLIGGLLSQFSGGGEGGAGLAGGLGGLIAQLQAGGLGDQVSSWVAKGPNQPVDAHALGQTLGPDVIGQLAGKTGLPIDQLLPALAGALPSVIDALTPDGKVPEGGAGGLDLGGLLGGLGGMLGGR